MINIENLKREALKEAHKIAEEGLRTNSEKIEKDFDNQMPEISRELWSTIETLCGKYSDMKEKGIVGELEWIYISFLRTGFIDHSPCYRIDLYDFEGCISEIECAGEWGFQFIYDCYYDIERRIVEYREKQSRLPVDEADNLLDGLIQYFRKLADVRIPILLRYGIEEFSVSRLFKNRVSIMLGEFLDHAKLAAEIEPEVNDIG